MVYGANLVQIATNLAKKLTVIHYNETATELANLLN